MIAQLRKALAHHLEIVVQISLQARLNVVDGWKRPGILHLNYVAFVHPTGHRLVLLMDVIELDDLTALIDLIQQHMILRCLVVMRR